MCSRRDVIWRVDKRSLLLPVLSLRFDRTKHRRGHVLPVFVVSHSSQRDLSVIVYVYTVGYTYPYIYSIGLYTRFVVY